MKQTSMTTSLVAGVVTMSIISSLGILGYLYIGWWSILVVGLIIGLPLGYKTGHENLPTPEILVDDWENYDGASRH